MEKHEFRHLVRIANTDIDGNKKIQQGVLRIKGIGFMMSEAILAIAGIDKNRKAGELNDEDIKKIDDVLKNPSKIPSWMYNRRNDVVTGEDKHLIGSDLDFVKQEDIRNMKKIRSFRGVRHIRGLPVRGQKTRSNFRKNKGTVLGVKRKKIAGKT